MLADKDGFERVTGDEVTVAAAVLIATASGEAVYVVGDHLLSVFGQAGEATVDRHSTTNISPDVHINDGEATVFGGISLAATALGAVAVSRMRHRSFKKKLAVDQAERIREGAKQRWIDAELEDVVEPTIRALQEWANS